eukprot:TRINITY_DN24089_c0_g1_i1.p1 TRINITY_DN24089_c0_g1~~TRINITY_DN24089_c0_g1_i1.p1  ORF type:complete len:342 (+),score=71.35 TRINITY_DN24089_c0_g1_i1:237-1262(+)
MLRSVSRPLAVESSIRQRWQSSMISLGDATLEMDKDIQRLKPSNNALGSRQTMLETLQEHGYLYIKGFHPRQAVLDARDRVLEHFQAQTAVLDTVRHPLGDGVLNEGCGVGCVPFLEGKNEVTHSPEVLAVLEGKHAYSFFDRLFGEPATSFGYKWLRGVHRQAFTGAHADNVYMSRGSQRLLTCWTPLMDIPLEMGTLAMLEGSNHLSAFDKVHATYTALDAEAANLQGTGWYTTDPLELSQQFGGTWKTDDFEAGDVLIFTMQTFHMSSKNQTDRVRVSCDTRWQPSADPIDPRYSGEAQGHGDAKFGLHNTDTAASKQGVTIDELKAQWGLRWNSCNN